MNTEQKSTGKKKSYSKKISKKELLEQTIARKNAADRVAEGGVYIGANGVSVSSAAMEARQAALRAAGGGFAAPVDERQQRPSRHASPTVVRIEPASPQGDRLAHCLWNAQVLLLDVLKFDTAADKLVSRYLREHREFGPRDRHVVAETVFAVLRQKRVFTHLAQSGGGAMERRLVLLGAFASVQANHLQAAIAADEWSWLSQIATADQSSLPAVVRSNLTNEWFEHLSAAYGEDGALALAQALNTTAPLDVRVNTVKSSREAVQVALKASGIDSESCALAPLGLRLVGKPALQKSEIFMSGAIEVQDEGSQLLTHMLGAKRGEMIADFCAGAGGKTLAIGAMMRNSGRLYAFDTAAHRLAKLKPRLARSGLSNVQTVAIDSETDVRVKRLYGKLDRVFIDAPCSGLGTLRRNPDLKWRHGVDSVLRLTKIQANILASAAKLVKVNGTVVYATCSVLPAENQDIVNAFLEANPNYVLVDVNEALAVQNITLPEGASNGGMMQLLPHLHNTDGFFAAVLKRVS